MLLQKKTKVLFSLVLWRLISVFVVQTAHVPDEYWQSLEVAHRLAFGYGYLSWEWTAKIHYVTILTTLPRVLQAIFSAYGEYKFYNWSKNKWTLYSLCLNWYWYYCATRTLVNTIETVCTMIALSIFPWRDGNVRNVKYLWIVGFLCMIRPTAAIIWLPLCLYHLCTSSQNKLVLIYKYSMICGICCLSSILLDSYCYGMFVISPWEFFRVNVLYKIGDSYGTQHLLWYILCGLPILLGCYYIVFLLCIWQIVKHPSRFHHQAVMLITIIWTLSVYSLLSHKEFRFVLPLLPMCIYICTSCTLPLSMKYAKPARKIIVGLLIVTNVLPGLYFSLIHQRGSLDVMNILHKEVVNSDDTSSILFLTPCHATPLYSHLHVNVSTRILTCEPNFTNDTSYVDEADVFFSNPMQWLDRNYDINESVTIPKYVVLFDNIVQKISRFLKHYQLTSQIFYAHFPQSNYAKYIYVYKHK
ncbi:unnamed protein product [Xylocopa violacea]|uniref:Mannosyltransferase n=1 Tax=Xylocopa violacea TaxID=135666 RepID=A0ABP1N0D2_XYLVO